MVKVEGMNVEAQAIANLEEEQRYFSIREAPHYEDVPDFKDPDKRVRKLIIPVKIYNGDELDYFPNRTSQKKMTELTGTHEMNNWTGKIFKWECMKQKVHGKDSWVLYISKILEPIKIDKL